MKHIFQIIILFTTVNTLKSQSIIFESDKIMNAYTRNDQTTINSILLNNGFKLSENPNTNESNLDIFKYTKRNKLLIDKVTFSKIIRSDNNTGLKLVILQYFSESTYESKYYTIKDYLKGKIDPRIYSNCSNLINLEDDYRAQSYNKNYCYQEP